MGFVNTLLQNWGNRNKKEIQGTTATQLFRDYHHKGDGYSVEAEVSETLANLVLMLSTMPISGDNERAKWLDGVADVFYRDKAKKLLSAAFLTGDALVIPSWTGRNIQNIVVSADDFEIYAAAGDEITCCGYIVDTKKKNNETYSLIQVLELKNYTANDGSAAQACEYRMAVARNGAFVADGLSLFPEWGGKFEQVWSVPNVDRLLIGRYKSFTTNPTDLNNVKGVPICYGASEPIREIHYLLDQMHNEFGLSEKAIMANKRLFKKEFKGDTAYTVLPSGRERLFVDTSGQDMEIHDWSPDIRYQAYLDAINKQETLVERAVGVSTGIISSAVTDWNYQNVDNVRKSQQKTMGFVSSAREQAEKCLNDLVYSWDVLANYYDVTPMGEYDVNYAWSDEYIETFTDRQQAILAGEAIGATDAIDYRMFVMDESPETARQRVEEIKATQRADNMLQMMQEA
jgi:A118 family predicted phage portal protein